MAKIQNLLIFQNIQPPRIEVSFFDFQNQISVFPYFPFLDVLKRVYFIKIKLI
jgi:hypothetical protein